MKKLILVGLLTILMLPMTQASATCLNQTDEQFLIDVANGSDILVRLFRKVCEKNEVNLVNQTYYNKTKELSELIKTLNSSVVNLKTKLAETNDIATFAYNNVTWLKNHIDDELNNKKEQLVEIFDDKINDLYLEFATKDEINLTEKRVINYFESNKLTEQDIWNAVIIGVVVSVGVSTLIISQMSTRVKRALPKLGFGEYTSHSVGEITTSKDFKLRKEALKDAKQLILKSNLKPSEKQQLLGMLYDGKITPEEVEVMLSEKKSNHNTQSVKRRKR